MTTIAPYLSKNNISRYYTDLFEPGDYCYINHLCDFHSENAYYFIQTYDDYTYVNLLLKITDDEYEVSSTFYEKYGWRNYDFDARQKIDSEGTKFGIFGKLVGKED